MMGCRARPGQGVLATAEGRNATGEEHTAERHVLQITERTRRRLEPARLAGERRAPPAPRAPALLSDCRAGPPPRAGKPTSHPPRLRRLTPPPDHAVPV